MLETGKEFFVFVVCGGKEHIDTLHYSLKYLRYYSNKGILVVTDVSRNEIPIAYNHVIDVVTPKEYNHHQASIYLKTGLHKFLPSGNTYCYLDTDIIALSTNVDHIFEQYVPPIRFAPDHCTMPYFSPSAVNCGCNVENKLTEELRALFEKYDKNYAITDVTLKEQKALLIQRLEGMQKSLWQRVINALKYHTSRGVYKLDADFWYDKQQKIWHNAEGKPVLFDINNYVQEIEASSGFRYDKNNQYWLTPDGRRVWNDQCQHLRQSIKETFGISVTDNNWQHWNGGVFLFDDASSTFLEAWHTKTLHIFGLKDWKTRDQGTLIATAWEMGLENSAPLAKEWNFIIDYYSPRLTFRAETGEFSEDNFETTYKPVLAHVYHNFGKKGWAIWDWIEAKGKQEGIL